MKTQSLTWLTTVSALLIIMGLNPTSLAQGGDSFSDELEAELEAEIGIGEEEAEKDDFVDVEEEEASEKVGSSEDEFSDEDFGDSENSEQSTAETDDFSDEDFSDEDFSEESAASFDDFSEDDFSDEEFTDEDFSDEDFNDEEFAEEPLEGNQAPVEQSVGDRVEESFEDPMAADEAAEEIPASEEIQEDPIEEDTSFANSGVNSSQSTEPNLEYEAKLYSIYKNFHSSPTSNADWQNMLGSRRAEVYTINKGDSLWGVSQTFFGDGNYWPKVWSINSKIENPHLIEPSNQIQFVMGTEDAAPMFTVTEAGSDEGGEESAPELEEKDVEQLIDAGALSAEDTQKLQEIIETDMDEALESPQTPALEADSSMDVIDEESQELEPDIEIPPPGVVSRPVLRKLPPSVPEWQGSKDSGKYDDLGISYGVRPITRLRDSAFLLSFVDDEESNSDAIVMETEKGGYFGSDLDYIYVKVPKGKGQTGDEYLVVRSHGRIRPPMISIETRDLGYQKQIAGLIRLGKKVKADVDEDEYEAFRARVVKSVNPIRLDSQLMKGSLPKVDLTEGGEPSNIVSQIIGGSGGKTMTVFGKGSIVYINRGQKEGIRVGQVLKVRSHKLNRFKKTKILEHNRVIGKIKIVKAVDRFATAVVLESDDLIFAGDLTGEGEYKYRKWGGVVAASSAGYSADSANGDDLEETEEDFSSDDELDQLLNEESEADDF